MNQVFDARCAGIVPSLRLLDTQRTAAGVLTKNGRLIVKLPTGAGKTLLAALPFAAGTLAPKQMVFMTPLRTLASAQASVLRHSIQGDAATRFLGAPWEVRIQTGAAPEDPLFEASVTVCTFDQALSSALSIAYSTSPGRRAINAGAVLGSYLVADELHLFPRDEALTTLLWLLTHRPDLPFTLMTATLSTEVTGELAKLLDAEVIDHLPATDVARLRLADRVRTVRWQPEPFQAPAITATAPESPDGRVIVVVNTVRRAQALADELATLLGWEQVKLLHSRFYPQDRALIESDVMRTFGKDRSTPALGEPPMVLVATQVIEAWLDISAGLLFTEWAPANALVQRWGRSARWGGRAHVVVAPPPDLGPEDLPLPYEREKAMQGVLVATRRWLEEHAAEELSVSAEIEQSFLDDVHVPSDLAWVVELSARIRRQGLTIGEAIQQGLYSHAGALIRRVDNRTVLIHGEPEILTKPWSMSGFSLAAGTLRGLLRESTARKAIATDQTTFVVEDEESDFISLDAPTVSWQLKVPISDPGQGEAFGEARSGSLVAWQPAGMSDVQSSPLFALNPSLAAYDARLGLRLGPFPDPAPPETWAAPVAGTSRPPFSRYRRETFEEHVAQMLDVFDRDPALWSRVAAIAPPVEAWCAWPPGLLCRIARAAIVLHDAGKLTDAWQAKARAYQQTGGNPAPPWLVHTDERPGARLDAPKHALAGAWYAIGVGQTLDAEVREWRRVNERRWPTEFAVPSQVLFTAIATHHGANPWTGCSPAFGSAELLSGDAVAHVEQVLVSTRLPANLPHPPLGQQVVKQLVRTDRLGDERWQQAPGYLGLAIVTRLLRLADGWSQDLSRRQDERG